MKRFWSILKWILVIWGIVCLLWVLFAIGTLIFRFNSDNKPSTEIASKNDVRFVLNNCQLGDSRIKEVVHSYKARSAFLSDHLYVHAIKISHVETKELCIDKFGAGWFRCDQVDGATKDAINFISGLENHDGISWFPKTDEIHSAEIYVYPLRIKFSRTTVEGAELIFVRPKDNMIFYVSVET